MSHTICASVHSGDGGAAGVAVVAGKKPFNMYNKNELRSQAQQIADRYRTLRVHQKLTREMYFI